MAGEGAGQSRGKKNCSLIEKFWKKLLTVKLGNCKVFRQPQSIQAAFTLFGVRGDEAQRRSGGAGGSCRSCPHSLELMPTVFFIYNLIIRRVW